MRMMIGRWFTPTESNTWKRITTTDMRIAGRLEKIATVHQMGCSAMLLPTPRSGRSRRSSATGRETVHSGETVEILLFDPANDGHQREDQREARQDCHAPLHRMLNKARTQFATREFQGFVVGPKPTRLG